MKKFRSAVLAPALATFLAMALTACGQSESPQSTGEDTGQAANQLLALSLIHISEPTRPTT